VRSSRLISVAVLAAASALVPVGGPALAAPRPAPVQPGSPGGDEKVALTKTSVKAAVAVGPLTVPLGLGPERNATFQSYALSDKVSLQVNAASGNLLLRTTDLVLPGIEDNLVLGSVYNSLLVGSDLQTGAMGRGWRARTGADVKLVLNDDASVTYAASDGVVDRFVPDGTATGYVTPKEFRSKLVNTGFGWTLTENESGKVSTFTSGGLLDKTTDRNGNLTDYQYDNDGQLVKVISDRGTAGARTVTVSYSGGRIVRLQQAADASNTRQVQYSYNSRGNLTQILSSSGHSVSFGYDSSLRISTIKTGLSASEPGTETRIDYDSLHRVVGIERVLASESVDNPEERLAITRWAYMSPTETLMADANTDASEPLTDVAFTTYTIDAAKRVTKVVDPAGRATSFAYTPWFDLSSVTDELGKTTTWTYGANDGQSLTQVQLPTGAKTTAAYVNPATTANPTAPFQPSSVTDAQGNTTAYAYNAAGNLISTTNAAGAKTLLGIGADGTPQSSTDPANLGDPAATPPVPANPTTFTYNGDKQLLQTVPPTGNTLKLRNFTYDAFGRLLTASDGTSSSDPQRRVNHYEYDLDDRITRVWFSTEPTGVDYRYDGSGNLITRTDASGVESFAYDRLNRLVQRGSVTDPTQLTYDAAGNLIKLHTTLRGDTVYTYDTTNRLIKQTTGNATHTYGYDDAGRRTTSSLAVAATGLPPKTAETVNAYDASGRLLRATTKRWQLVNGAQVESLVSDQAYCYSKINNVEPCSTAPADDTGLKQWQTDLKKATFAVTAFTYDKANRVTKSQALGRIVCRNDPSDPSAPQICRRTPVPGTFDFTYDLFGNRLTKLLDTLSLQTLAFNTANQIVATGVSFDPAGYQTDGFSAENAAYSSAGQTTALTTAETAATLTYLAADQTQLGSVTSGGTSTTSYVWGRNDSKGTPQLDQYRLPGGDTHVLERDADGTIAGLRVHATESNSWTTYWPVLDDNGSVIALVDEDGSLAGTYSYDLYGAATTVADDPVASAFAVGYAGGVRVGGLVKFGKRYYDPVTGRFTQQRAVGILGDAVAGNRYAPAPDTAQTRPTSHVWAGPGAGSTADVTQVGIPETGFTETDPLAPARQVVLTQHP
jgi:YD repeat-containing protein